MTAHRDLYSGRRLAGLLAALLIPAALLYLRLVLGLAATSNRIDAAHAASLGRWSLAALGCFFAAQIAGAWFLMRLFPPARSFVGRAAHFLLSLATGVFFSLAAAVSLEAFGWNVFLRVAAP